MTNKDAEPGVQQESATSVKESANDDSSLAGEENSAAKPDSADITGEATEADLAEQLAAALEQNQEMKEGHLRAQAEVENIRRRSQNEVIQARKYAIEGFAQELLTVKDSLDQAALVELGEAESEAVVRMQEGLELTLKQLETVLGKFSVVEVEAGAGVKFNPEHHQAISMVPSEEVNSGDIVAVMQKGFLLKDRLLRPAMVVVAS